MAVRLKEIGIKRSDKIVAFKDEKTGEMFISDCKTVYRKYHNQIVTVVARLPKDLYAEILIIGEVK